LYSFLGGVSKETPAEASQGVSLEVPDSF